jgi:hypothetical protein
MHACEVGVCACGEGCVGAYFFFFFFHCLDLLTHPVFRQERRVDCGTQKQDRTQSRIEVTR